MSEQNWPARWELGEDFIPKDRYLSREFLALELEKLWPRIWQVACRIEQLPEQGSYVEYNIGDQSILVVRVDPGSENQILGQPMFRVPIPATHRLTGVSP